MLAQQHSGRRQSAESADAPAARESTEAQRYTTEELFALIEELNLGVSRRGVTSPRAAAVAPDP